MSEGEHPDSNSVPRGLDAWSRLGTMDLVSQAEHPKTSPADRSRPPEATPGNKGTLSSLILDLLRPYRTGLAIVLGSMLVQTLTSLAAP